MQNDLKSNKHCIGFLRAGAGCGPWAGSIKFAGCGRAAVTKFRPACTPAIYTKL